MNFRKTVVIALCLGLMTALSIGAVGASASDHTPHATKKGAKKGKVKLLRGNPSDKRLASEFLLMLQKRDKAGLRKFFAPAFLIQRGDGSWLHKSAYLKEPARVDKFRIRGAVGTCQGKRLRVIRFELNTVEKIDGRWVPRGWVPRLSTFVKRHGYWQILSHANFLQPPQS